MAAENLDFMDVFEEVSLLNFLFVRDVRTDVEDYCLSTGAPATCLWKARFARRPLYPSPFSTSRSCRQILLGSFGRLPTRSP